MRGEFEVPGDGPAAAGLVDGRVGRPPRVP